MAKKNIFIDDESLNFRLIGLKTGVVEETRFIYLFNQSFKTFFKRIDDLDVVISFEKINYTTYHFYEEKLNQDYYLISNTAISKTNSEPSSLANLFSITPYLVPEYKNYNFLFKVTGNVTENTIFDLPLINSEFISYGVDIPLKKLKSIDNIIF